MSKEISSYQTEGILSENFSSMETLDTNPFHPLILSSPPHISATRDPYSIKISSLLSSYSDVLKANPLPVLDRPCSLPPLVYPPSMSTTTSL